MHLNRKLAINIVVFWLVCFCSGYIFAPQIKAIFSPQILPEKTTVKSNSGKGVDSDPFIQSVDPTSLETLLVETYSNDEGSPFYINSISNDYYMCEKFDPSTKHEISDPDNLLAFVNKWYKIGYEYSPSDLVLISDYGIKTNGNIYDRKETVEQFKKLYDELNNQGYKVVVSSGWRSFAHQQRILNNWSNMVGARNANNYAALPGYSEHHLGTVVDILTPENGYSISPNYFNTKTFKWMNQNAYKYGFVLSYPQGKTSITGYNPEAWHWRYVGIETAAKVHEQGITFTEYLFNLHNICL